MRSFPRCAANTRAAKCWGKPVNDYRAEPNVDPRSQTETYVAMRLWIDNWRWAGVPFYLRTGKSMTKRKTQIAIQFKQAPLTIFRNTGVEKMIPNWLVLNIQPDEGILWEFGAKVPGPHVQLEPVQMRFSYKDFFKVQPSTGYETLIYDAMIRRRDIVPARRQYRGRLEGRAAAARHMEDRQAAARNVRSRQRRAESRRRIAGRGRTRVASALVRTDAR